jgi:acetylornithine deacetylase/succinyl-diaminopimelate desuccinylase-like protein
VAALALGILPSEAQAQTAANPRQVVEQVREYRRANEHRIVSELVELLSIPNVAADTANIQRNAAKLVQMLERRGFRARLLPIANRGPVVFAALATPGATRTIIFYAHYDGQPVEPGEWTGTQPWEPALRTNAIHLGGTLIPFPAPPTPYQDDWRIFARSASDDKSPIVAILTALDSLRARKIPLAVNIKLVLEGEEEDGSPNLEKVLNEHRTLLSGDVLISVDGPVHQSGRPQIVFGNRGMVGMEITVFGPYRSLHSGHYGNWTPNPAMRLAQLLASMKDAEGRVLVEGFYDDVVPLSDLERRAIAEMPPNEPDLMREQGIAEAEGGGKRLPEMIALPSLNVRGLRSAFVGAESRTIIPDKAIASLDVRLVKNIDPQRQFARVVAHIRKQGYYVVDRDPTHEERMKYPRIAKVVMYDGYPAARVPMDHPAAQAIVRVVESGLGEAVVKLPTSGGSAPMYIFERLGLPVIHLPSVNHDNNQHSPNENLRVGTFWRAIEIFGALLAELEW